MSKKKRKVRRTPEQLIEDLKEKIKEVELRAKAKELAKTSNATKQAITSMRSLDKAMQLAKEEGNSELRGALVSAHDVLGDYLRSQGLKIPKSRGRRKAGD